VKEWDPVSEFDWRVESTNTALCGFTQLQSKYFETVESKLNSIGANTGLVTWFEVAFSGGGCLLSSSIALESSFKAPSTFLHMCGSLGFLSFMVLSRNMSSVPMLPILIYWRNVSMRGNGEDVNSYDSYKLIDSMME